MNYLELALELARKAAIPSSDLTDVSTATGETGHVVRWIKDAYLDIQTQQSINWKFLHTEYTRNTRANQTLDASAAVDKGGGLVGIPITAHGFSESDSIIISGTDNYDGTYAADATTSVNELVITATYVAETFSNTDTAEVKDYEFYTAAGIQQMDLVSFYYYLASDSSNNRSPLAYVEYKEFKRKHTDYSTPSSPAKITITPTKSLRIYPIPDDVYTVEVDAFFKPQELVASEDIPLMPTNFHMMIVWKALIDYAGFEETGAVFQHAAMRYDELYNQLLWQEKYETESMVVQSDTNLDQQRY